jgi:anti-sigma factor ChrR (cupin superfamily)
VRSELGTCFDSHRHWEGKEIVLLEVVFEDEHGSYPAASWIRHPHLSQHTPFSSQACLIYVKTGHLDG